MESETELEPELLERLRSGDQQVLADLFDSHRARLLRMVRLRIDRRLRGRIDPWDVLQEAFLDALRRLPEYLARPSVPFFLWLRGLTGQRLLVLHRFHLGTRMRDAGLEVSLMPDTAPQVTSVALAAHFAGDLTSPSEAAIRNELIHRLQETLEAMEPMDREIIALRHFEELSNKEVAEVLGIQRSAASNRYVRALGRIRQSLAAALGPSALK